MQSILELLADHRIEYATAPYQQNPNRERERMETKRIPQDRKKKVGVATLISLLQQGNRIVITMIKAGGKNRLSRRE